jgi:hypothetical protein
MRCRVATALLVACSAGLPVPPARFENAQAVDAVDDRRDVAVAPAPRRYFPHLYQFDGVVRNRITHALDVKQARRALGVNALDEVPNSTWFTNRIGVRDMSLDELRAGPIRSDSPELHKPWMVTTTKIGGTEIGFLIKDARGIKFLLKFDQHGAPESDTATHVIVNRFWWAAGYNVPEDFIVTFRRDDLALAPHAVIRDASGHEDALSRAELDRRLDSIDNNADGTIRGMASRWLPGKALGGHPPEGVRADDPNDRIPHERRRDLRGLRTFAAWLDDIDIRDDNFVDTWQADPRDPKRHYVVHYRIDFGESFGMMAANAGNLRMGFEYGIDLARMARSLVTLGLEVRPWEHRGSPKYRGIGTFEADSFDPGNWYSATVAYVPFVDADRFDRFWGAKLVMRFTRAQIRAIVETGELSDPRSIDYLVDTLVARQRKTGAYWFARVNPLDGFAIANDALCFDDLWLTYGLGEPAATTRYAIATYDRAARPIEAPTAIAAAASGRTCTAPLALARDGDRYTIVKIATTRPGFTGATYVHVARDPATRAARVIGVWRE